MLGFWWPRLPHWLNLSPRTCTDVQSLIDSHRPNGRRAGELTVLVHEALHAYGSVNEAETNCHAIQLLPTFGLSLGFSPSTAKYLGKLAYNYVRRGAPRGYWDAARCRDGGTWDLNPGIRNLDV